MTAFTLALSPVARPLLAFVVTHGLTDFGSVELLPSYVVCLACPAPTLVVTFFFCAASVLHLALELGRVGSLALHLLVLALALRFGNDAAFGTFLVYFSLWHTPLHYVREHRRGNGALAAIAAIAGCVLSGVWSPSTVVLTDRLQRIVIAHVAVVYTCRR